ncbi:MAG TPA: hypothetical protein DCS71_01365 [Flavobacteriales bacterium]|nr:hypothetical protein [Flavobacteriales bacterium]
MSGASLSSRPVWVICAMLILSGCGVGEVDQRAVENRRYTSYAQGFQWLSSMHGEPVLAICQPRTGIPLATVAKSEVRWQRLPDPWNRVPHVHIRSGRGYVTTSTTHVHLMDAGGALAGWRGCTSIPFLRDSTVRAWADSNGVRDVRGDGGLNVEVMAMMNVGCILTGPDQDLTERSWPWVPITEYLEPHPLGRAEWMIPLGWLAGDSATASVAFEGIEQAYFREMSLTKPSSKRVFTGSVADGIWHAPGHDSFVAQWIRDAGGIYALSQSDQRTNVELGLESMLELVNQTDAWVLVTYDPDTLTMRDIEAMDPRHVEVMQAVDEVWVCNTEKVDYFGTVVAHPEWVLADLAALLRGQPKGPYGLFSRMNFQSPSP